MPVPSSGDLLQVKEEFKLDPLRKRPWKFLGRSFLVLLISVGVLGAVFSYQITVGSEGTGSFPKLSIFSTIKQLVTTSDQLLNGEKSDRINILLMGVGGAGHDGPQLSDTIILASYQPSTKDIGLISIPRDLYVPIPGYGWRKINAANAYGEMETKGTGPNLASQVISDVFKQPIHYYVRVDFSGFADLIDDLGGVDIVVENSFTDPEYPTVGKENAECGTTTGSFDEEGNSIIVPNYSCRYEVLRFIEGSTHMSGETALKFVRSRHGTNGEGSDFARSRRQQLILLAVREKLLSASTILNPSRLSNILETLQDNIATNLETWEILRFAQIMKDIDTNNLKNHVLDTSTKSPLYATSKNGAYVLLPKDDNWSALEQLAINIFSEDPLTIPLPSSVASNTNTFTNNQENKPKEKKRLVQVEIQNGTSVTGLAYKTSQIIDGDGFAVRRVGNASTRGYEQTVIYDFSNGQFPAELKALREYLGGDVVVSLQGWRSLNGVTVPQELMINPDEFATLAKEADVDFLVILGQNSEQLIR